METLKVIIGGVGLLVAVWGVMVLHVLHLELIDLNKKTDHNELRKLFHEIKLEEVEALKQFEQAEEKDVADEYADNPMVARMGGDMNIYDRY